MSEDNNRYKNGKIYTIRYINDDSLIYVGSTIQPLYKRFHEHKRKCFNEKNKEYNKILYVKIRETNNINDWYIELYEDYPTTSKENLLKREGEVIREIGSLNKIISGRTGTEYRENNKDKILEYHKEYYKSNEDKIKQDRKEYYENNKDTIKERDKKYYNSNKDKILESNRQYREDNKEQIKERRSVIITCTCGCQIRKQELTRHQQTNKHKKLVSSNNSI
jgi:hypothetical protein